MTLREAVALLTEAGIESAVYDARELFMRIGGLGRGEVISPNASCELPSLCEAVKRRAKREPLQYIIGEVGFWRETYTVTPDCLIPRPDTELLVEYAVKELPSGARFADLCTGSGCIAVSTLAHRPDATAIGLDLFEETAKLALHNAERNGVSNRFDVICADLLAGNPFGEGEFDAIISNPPYIRTAVVDTLEEELFSEPRAALDGGENGLVFYEKILLDYKKSLKRGGFILFEIGYDQGAEICALARLNGFVCEIRKDLSGNDRMAILG